MKLQKMVYFAHGYNLAKRNEPLIKEEIQAWKFGPVVPTIYNDYKLYGRFPISNMDMVASFAPYSMQMLGEDALDAINYTWKATKNLTAADFSAWTHLKGSPWDEVYSEYDLSIPIENEKIKKYFKSFLFKNGANAHTAGTAAVSN